MTDEVVGEQVYGVLIAYSPEKDRTYAILYGEFKSEVLLERDEDMNWWAIVHKLADGTEHMIEPPYNAGDPVEISKSIAVSNDIISEGINTLLAEEGGEEVA